MTAGPNARAAPPLPVLVAGAVLLGVGGSWLWNRARQDALEARTRARLAAPAPEAVAPGTIEILVEAEPD